MGLGIISAILGILLIFKSATFIGVIAPCIGIFLIADAALRIQTSISAKRFGITNWWVILIIAIVVAVVGVMLLFVPFKTVAVITRLVGLCLCFDGIMNLVVVQSTVHTIKREKDIIDID